MESEWAVFRSSSSAAAAVLARARRSSAPVVAVILVFRFRLSDVTQQTCKCFYYQMVLFFPNRQVPTGKGD